MAAISTHQFIEQWLQVPVFIQITLMKDSFILWVSTNDKFGDLAVATPSRLLPQPPTTKLLGVSANNDRNESLARQLAIRTKRQVFVSCSLPQDDEEMIMPVVLRRVITELDRLLPS